MVQESGPETSAEQCCKRRMQLVFARQVQERQLFMQELKDIRKNRDKSVIKTIKNSIGPKWYQVLSEPQRNALDTLESGIYQDLLEGRPIRTSQIMRIIGIHPRPNNIDLLNCVYMGRDDPKVMLAELFQVVTGHSVNGKQASYNLNERLLLSSIYYLGLKNLLAKLKEKFHVEQEKDTSSTKSKRSIQKEPPVDSPYLEKMVAVLYEKPKHTRQPPPPLPNLEELLGNDEPYEEEPVIQKPPPPPPPPPPPKKRLARSFCDKVGGVQPVEAHSSGEALSTKPTRAGQKRLRNSKLMLSDVKKSYGLGIPKPQGGNRRKKPVVPSTGMESTQYLINGVYFIRGRAYYVIGNVCTLPPNGEIIHGGHKCINGECINIHCGIRGHPPPPAPDPCDCVKKYYDTVVSYVKRTKCYCGHHYDYGNEGIFAPEEVPLFQKPTRHSPMGFNYHTIYDVDEKQQLVEKEMKRVWDTQSLLQMDGEVKDDKKDRRKKKSKKSSATCLGENPTPEDYLKCALQPMRRDNVAAQLPDVYQTPELREWMRNRIHGPLTETEKKNLLRKSSKYWQILTTLATKGFGHVYPRKDVRFKGNNNWTNKFDLQDKFKKYKDQYKLELFRSHAAFNNMLWPSMMQEKCPDKKFREIYFSYLLGSIGDLLLMHPYSSRETLERKFTMMKRRYCCPPAGAENIEH